MKFERVYLTWYFSSSRRNDSDSQNVYAILVKDISFSDEISDKVLPSKSTDDSGVIGEEGEKETLAFQHFCLLAFVFRSAHRLC